MIQLKMKLIYLIKKNLNKLLVNKNRLLYIILFICKGFIEFSYYKSYRSKVISEENFIRGQLDIYKLEKVCKT